MKTRHSPILIIGALFAGFLGITALYNCKLDYDRAAEKSRAQYRQFSQPPELPSEVVRLTRKMEAEGGLKIDSKQARAWIHHDIWLHADAQNKETITRVLAALCAEREKRGVGLMAIDLFEMQSAQPLASYGPINGFQVAKLRHDHGALR